MKNNQKGKKSTFSPHGASYIIFELIMLPFFRNGCKIPHLHHFTDSQCLLLITILLCMFVLQIFVNVSIIVPLTSQKAVTAIHFPMTNDNNNIQHATNIENLKNIMSNVNDININTQQKKETEFTNKRPRIVISLTAVNKEIPNEVNNTINNLLFKQTYKDWIDTIHLNIPYLQLRHDNQLYPSTDILRQYFPQSKVQINRILADSGPITRYIGAIENEKNNDTIIITLDMDPWNFNLNTIEILVNYSLYDDNCVWTVWGENFEWHTNIHPSRKDWNVNYNRVKKK